MPDDMANEQRADRDEPARRANEPGHVYLVGAGPGDRGLLTARALELIACADTILYDRLIPIEALDGARADAELLFVGKQGGGDSVPQEHTQALLIERALAGRQVVRLKGGDPFVFGRGGEEALALRAAGIDFSVVPGVTAGIAAAAYAGIPVTHRGLSTAVALITGHTRAHSAEHVQAHAANEPSLDWPALAAFPGTLVFYMGVSELERIASSLIEAGRPAEQPVAIVERATFADQRSVVGTLATIAALASEAQVKAPAITLVGDVAGLTRDLQWLPARPLAGRMVAVTRARAQASELARQLAELGARVVQAPTIKIQPLPARPLDPRPYDLICLTSPNGVGFLFEHLAAGGRDARALAGIRVAAMGPATARALAEHGIVADIIPERYVAESLVQALADRGLADSDMKRVLIARASKGRDVLPDALRARGATVDVLALYETLPEPLSESALTHARTADYIVFTSSSTVDYFVQALNAAHDKPVSTEAPANIETCRSHSVAHHMPASTTAACLSAKTRIASIGPATSATLREHGLEPHIEAEQHTIEGLVNALLAHTIEHAD